MNASEALVELIPQILSSKGKAALRMYGSSMSPLLAEGRVVEVVPFKEQKIRVGDIVCFKSKSQLTAHRVVKLMPSGCSGESFVLTKGDNVRHFDLPLSTRQILGRVVTIEERSITTLFWRIANAWIAKASYLEGAFSEFKTKNSWWRVLQPWKRKLGLKSSFDFISPLLTSILKFFKEALNHLILKTTGKGTAKILASSSSQAS